MKYFLPTLDFWKSKYLLAFKKTSSCNTIISFSKTFIIYCKISETFVCKQDWHPFSNKLIHMKKKKGKKCNVAKPQLSIIIMLHCAD